MRQVVLTLVLGLILSGCAGLGGALAPAAGMTPQQKKTVSKYPHHRQYGNAVVYSRDPIGALHPGVKLQPFKLGPSAVWFIHRKRLVEYRKLVYVHEQATGRIHVREQDSVRR